MPSTPSSSAGPEPLQSELENFRTRWLRDLNLAPSDTSSTATTATPTTDSASPISDKARGKLPLGNAVSAADNNEDIGDVDLVIAPSPLNDEESDDDKRDEEESGTGFGPGMFEGDMVARREPKELVTALDHFEEAMKKEAHGNLGDSLNLYRKAYRMDASVDKAYRAKHFPTKPAASTSKATFKTTTQSPAPTTTTTTEPPGLLSTPDLLASFANLSIISTPASIPNTPPPPCPIATLPYELLYAILEQVALDDIADYARIALVSKRFAFIVSAEDRIWRSACLSFRFGFPSMHYSLPTHRLYDGPTTPSTIIPAGSNRADRAAAKSAADFPQYALPAAEPRLSHAQKVCSAMLPTKPYHNSWRALYKQRPRIRFNGVYISRNVYHRQGQIGANEKTVHSIHHVVTFFRYLRFYRDGSAISLTTTEEPADVVPVLARENLNRTGEYPSLAYALVGRWRMADTLKTERERRFHPVYPAEKMPWEHEGDVIVETEGVDPKYQYMMQMSVRTVGKKSVHNKLIWNGFWCLHTMLERWSDFPLDNEKAFVFSRVRSFGFAEEGLVEEVNI